MGSPKAALEWHGSTLLRRTVGILARATGGPVVVVRAWGQELPPLPPDVEVVDVTNELVALFHPSEKVLGWVKDLKNHPPMPLEQITDDMD